MHGRTNIKCRLTFAILLSAKFRSAWMLTVNISNTHLDSAGLTSPSFCEHKMSISNKVCKRVHFVLYKVCKICETVHTGCNRRNGPDFGRVFLRSNYTDITQNTYIQSWTVTEILAREKSGLLSCLRTVLVGDVILPLLELNSYVIIRCSASDLDNGPASKSV